MSTLPVKRSWKALGAVTLIVGLIGLHRDPDD
jgi:hypothetical protein